MHAAENRAQAEYGRAYSANGRPAQYAFAIYCALRQVSFGYQDSSLKKFTSSLGATDWNLSG
jgi:hypothetical protein